MKVANVDDIRVIRGTALRVRTMEDKHGDARETVNGRRSAERDAGTRNMVCRRRVLSLSLFVAGGLLKTASGDGEEMKMHTGGSGSGDQSGGGLLVGGFPRKLGAAPELSYRSFSADDHKAFYCSIDIRPSHKKTHPTPSPAVRGCGVDPRCQPMTSF